MEYEHEDLLWRRVAELRGIRLPKLGERAYISGERFSVQVALRQTPTPEPMLPKAITPIGLKRARILSEAEQRARAQAERRPR